MGHMRVKSKVLLTAAMSLVTLGLSSAPAFADSTPSLKPQAQMQTVTVESTRVSWIAPPSNLPAGMFTPTPDIAVPSPNLSVQPEHYSTEAYEFNFQGVSQGISVPSANSGFTITGNNIDIDCGAYDGDTASGQSGNYSIELFRRNFLGSFVYLETGYYQSGPGDTYWYDDANYGNVGPGTYNLFISSDANSSGNYEPATGYGYVYED